MRRRLAPFALLVAVAMAVAGCLNPFNPRVAPSAGVSEPAPVPNSPRNVLELFKWCWEHRALTEYKTIFTDDFRFVATGVDSSGGTDQGRVENREDELVAAEHLFIGGKADEPPANRIILDFNSDLIALSDPRPGKNAMWHKVIQTSVTLSVDTDAENFRISGDARFYVVRGDSAVIPAELGYGPDENRWYIERWEDLTGEGSQALSPGTLARLRVLLRDGLQTSSRDPSSVFPSRSVGGRGGTAREWEEIRLSWMTLKRIYR